MAETTEQRVVRVIAEQLDKKPDEISPTATFVDDLDVDTLEVMQVVMATEEEFGIEIADDDLEDLNTVADLIALVTRLSTH